MLDVIYVLWLRNVLRYIQSKSRIIALLGMPLFFLIILGFGLNPVMNIPVQQNGYKGFVIPGVVAMSVLFMSIFSGVQIIWDKQVGFIKETLIAPVTRLEIMVGQTLGGATTAIIQGLLTLIIAVLFSGITVFSPYGFCVALVFMMLVGISFTALGIAFSSQMEDTQVFQLIMSFVIFPIFGLSGALFPISTLPSWMKFLTYLDPLTYGVEGIRWGLFGQSAINPVTSFIVLSAFTAVTVTVGQHLFKSIKI
ncbi:ABC-2 type transporter [uncultured archaeon]|nr:ABC-2 type transporter [uncultured archaeon]